MYAFLARRLLAAIPVILVVALFVFLLLHVSPGDPAAIIAGDMASAHDIERIRARLGLDRPLPEQFIEWAWALIRGDLGSSIFSNLPVSRLIAQRIEPTIALTVLTMAIAIALAVPIGVLAAWRAGTWVDRLVMGFAVLGFSVPVFALGYFLIWIFAVRLDWLPVQGYSPIAQGLWPFLVSLTLPSLALGIVYVALIARMTRASMIEVLNQDYIRTAKAKGLSQWPVLLIHALKPASVPIVTTIGIGVALLLGGVVVTESVFNIPGLGRLTVDAILRRDYPVIQGVILVFVLIYLIINLAVDLIYTVLDPRIRY
ncbi:MAG: ABC transporter permease [Alphaproteobacteria bacterium]|nr:ABC transporter permease [Alphaproteobacteria bacterium]